MRHNDPSAQPSPLSTTHRSRCTLFHSVGVHDRLTQTDPLLSFEVFRLSGAVIPPHPHAGCAVAHYILPDAAGGLRSRLAQGEAEVARPGDLLWLDAHCGTVHQETPADGSVECRGLQVVVNYADGEREGAPQQRRVPGEQMPCWQSGGVELRLVCGQWQERQAPLVPHAGATLLTLNWQSDDTLSLALPEDRHWFALVLDGCCRIDGVLLAAGGSTMAATLPAGTWNVSGTAGAGLALLGGAPLHEPVIYQGAFAVRDEAQLVDTLRRYQEGAMGTLGC